MVNPPVVFEVGYVAQRPNCSNAELSQLSGTRFSISRVILSKVTSPPVSKGTILPRAPSLTTTPMKGGGVAAGDS